MRVNFDLNLICFNNILIVSIFGDNNYIKIIYAYVVTYVCIQDNYNFYFNTKIHTGPHNKNRLTLNNLIAYFNIYTLNARRSRTKLHSLFQQLNN